MKQREDEAKAGSGRSDAAVPRGIEVLVKKAAVDEEFRGELLAKRGEAAARIGLELDPAEGAILRTISEEHLSRIIGQTVVPAEQRRVFLGGVAAAMLAVLGVGLVSCEQSDATGTATSEKSQLETSAGILAEGPPVAVAGATPPAPPTEAPTRVAGLRMETPPATSTQTAPATGTGPASRAGSAVAAPPVDMPPRVTVFGLMRAEPQPGTQTAPATGAAPLMRIAGEMIDRPPERSTQTAPAIDPAELGLQAGLTAARPPATSTQTAPATGTAPAVRVAGLMIDRPPETNTQPASGPVRN